MDMFAVKQCCQFRGFPAQLGGVSDSLAIFGGRGLWFRNLPRVLGYRGFEREPMVS